MHLSDPLLVDLAGAGELAEKRRQFAQKGHEDAHSEDDNHKDPAQLEATWLRYVTVADGRNGHNGPIDCSNPLMWQRRIV